MIKLMFFVEAYGTHAHVILIIMRLIFLRASWQRMADFNASRHVPSREVTQQIWLKADAVCFDVDSTVVTIEGLDSLAEYCGVGDEVKQWTKRAMGGSVTFQEALKARLNIVKPTEHQVHFIII